MDIVLNIFLLLFYVRFIVKSVIFGLNWVFSKFLKNILNEKDMNRL